MTDATANGFGDIMQLGYVVEDIESAALEWSRRVGAGPFYVLDQQSFDNYNYRGTPTALELSMAFGYWGEMQVELITPLNDTDNLYTAALKAAPGRLNHYATVVSDLDGLLARYNLEERVIHSGAMPSGLQFVYLEEYMPGGLHLELIEPPAGGMDAFEGMKAYARTWDGKNPVRPMAELGADLAAFGG